VHEQLAAVGVLFAIGPGDSTAGPGFRFLLSVPLHVHIGVTAYAACNGLGRTTREVIDGLVSGRRGLTACPLEVPFAVPCGVVPGDLPPPPAELAAHDTRQLRIGLLGFAEIATAVEQAIHRYGAHRVGLVLGTSTGGLAEGEAAYFHWLSHASAAPGYDFERQHVFGAFTEALARAAGITGPAYTISTACSSSAKVFSSARRLLRSRRCDAVVVGGVDSLCLTTVRGFHSLGVAAPQGSRPFSLERDGMNVGEGAAFLLLERDPTARVHLAGIGESSDAFHMSAPHPEGIGAAQAMRNALADAGLKPSDIDYVNAHGTGTLRNDSAESLAILAVFGAQTPVVSTKSYTGHMLGASGATEALLCIVTIERQFIPANLGVAPRDPELGLHLPEQRMDTRVRRVLSSSFAFGGSNIALVFEEAVSP